MPKDTKIQTLIIRNGRLVQLNFGDHISVQFRAAACLFWFVFSVRYLSFSKPVAFVIVCHAWFYIIMIISIR